MQILIEIPKELYIACEKLCKTHHLSRVEDAIGKGIPLPEHHGRLIDEYILESQLNEVFKVMEEVPTIIPATKESARTMLDCYKCKNNKADISCEKCNYEPATKEGDGE